MSASRWDAGGSSGHRSGALERSFPGAPVHLADSLANGRIGRRGAAHAVHPNAQLELDSDVDIATLPGFVGFVHE